MTKHCKVGTVAFENVILTNACTVRECAWHTSHYEHVYQNGCVKLSKLDSCLSGKIKHFMTVEEAKEKGLIRE